MASRVPKAAQSFAENWGIPRSYGSYAELLDDPSIDVVYIPLPNHLHFRWVTRALEHGKHVLCEKPLALCPDQVDHMAALAYQNDLVLLEAFQFRFHPQSAMISRVLRDFGLGPIQLVKAHFSFSLKDPQDIRMRPETGGGSLWDIGCYPVCLMQALLGKGPLEVFAWQSIGPTGVDVSMVGQLRYLNGAIGQFDCGFIAPFRVGAEVVCAEGRVVLNEAWRAGISGAGSMRVLQGSRTHKVRLPRSDPFGCEVASMEAAILDRECPAYTVEHSRDLVRTLAALYRSALGGQPVVPDRSHLDGL